MYGDLAVAFRRAASAYGDVGFERYHDDPVGFCVDVLGYEPWQGQKRVLEALARRDEVTVPAGRAVGKSRLDASAALWFVATRGPNTRVICTGPTNQVVQNVFWEELRNLFIFAKQPLRGECAKKSTTGCRLANGAQILGLTAERPEGFQGIRAGNMLVIVDEASGVDDTIYTVIEGNMAGGSKLLLTGNPTKTKGYFRESLRDDSRFECIKLPSTESPNILAGEILVKGLATREWLDERRREWGEDSPEYKIHVLGEVVEGIEGRLFSPEMLAASESQWAEAVPSGRLVVGIDPAGASGDGDESAFVARRGRKILKVHARRGLTEQGHLTEALGLLATLKGDSSETPLVVIDRDGYVGARVYAEMSAFQMQHESAFQLYGVRSGEKARRKPLVYNRVRDEVWYGLVDAFREGLAIPPDDVKLTRELAEIKADPHISGRSQITGKDELRRELGRSPDRADALALACFEVAEWRHDTRPAPPPVEHNPYRAPEARGIDPYSALDAWSYR